jgi:hypothetical protein
MKYLSIKKINKRVIFSLFLLILFPIFRTEAVGINSSLPNLGADSLKTGLVGYWTFDGNEVPWTSASAATALDSSGNGNTATLVGLTRSVSPVVGKLGQALYFPRTSSTNGVNTSSSIGSTGTGYSFSFWFKEPNINLDTYYLFAWADIACRFGGRSTNTINCYADAGSTGSAFYSTTVNDNKWHHVVFTTTDGGAGSNNQVLYVDGVSRSTATETANGYASRMWIASDVNGLTANLKGTLDDFRFYSRVLSISEIKQLYNLGNSKINEPLPNFGGDSLKTGLVGYWTFDGTNMKSNVADVSGNSNNGNMTNFAATSTVVTPGKLGQALKFDGVDDLVTIPPSSSVNDLPKLTIAFWAKPESLGVSRTNVAKADNTSGGHGWRVGSGSGTASIFSFSVLGFVGGDLLTSSGAGAFVAGQWAHYVATWDGTTQARGVHLYKNGVELAATYIDAGTATLQSDSLRNIVLGRESGMGDNFFRGVMDDVRLYNRILSISEIKQLYNLGNSKINEPLPNLGGDSLKTGLIGYWTFDGANMKSNVTDVSGSGNNGLLTNFAATSTVVTPGKLGQALKFDGTDDIVTTPQLSTGTGPFSISAWVKVDDLTGRSFNNGVGIIAHFNNDLAGDFALSITSGYSVSFLNNRTGGNDSTGESETSANVVSKNKWAHVVAVWDGSVNKIYVNGVSKTFTSSSWGDWGTESGLGRLANLSLYYYKGAMDDIRVYNRALTANEISQIYKLGI